MEPADSNERARPLLIYDGDCGFCRYCVEYARAATGERIDYRPYQAVADQFPDIPVEAFRDAIQLVQPDGTVNSGAGAAFRTLAQGGYLAFWWRLYRALPLFASLCEGCYSRVAGHRSAAYRICRVLFGPRLRPGRVDITTWLFLRGLALVYLAAFVSLTWQAPGLIGDTGILPASLFFDAVDLAYGPEKFALLPSLLWLNASTGTIVALGLAGCLLSFALLLDRATRPALPLLYLLYLSLYHGGQQFMTYQWDVLLLECGFLAIFLPYAPRLITWLYRWLLFRFMLQSGLVKWLSGDPAWRDLSALRYHFETQPLPNVLAWHAHHLPDWLLRAGVAYTLLVELLVPFLMLLPRRPRQWAAGLTALLQAGIALTGSYNFFNLLVLCLCLLLLDDPCLERLLSRGAARRIRERKPWSNPVGRVLTFAVAGLYLLVSALLLGVTSDSSRLSGLPRQLVAATSPLLMANGYGLFAVMTTQRPEIVFEGSRDGRTWLPYELPYKPGAPGRPPGWASPHQPRLDWQLWFAALEGAPENRWVGKLVARLLQGDEPVLALFANNPFEGEPPRYVRARLYLYRYTDREQRDETGSWWQREPMGEFWPITAWQLPMEREYGRGANREPDIQRL